MNGINGTPQGKKHQALGGKKLGKPVTAAGSGGAATGGGCGSHALIPDPQSMTAAETLVGSIVAAAVVAVLAWCVVGAVAWRQRGDQS